jgi:hypothetical protein
VLVGCSPTVTRPIVEPVKTPQYSLVGTWAFEKAPAGVESGIEFKEDKTWRNWYRNKDKSADQSGHYSLEGDELILTRTFAKQSGKVSSAEETNTTVLRWDSKDRMSMIAKDGTPMYFNRK